MTWERPSKAQIPDGYSEDDFDETMEVRVVRYRVKNSEDKWETFEIVTTLLDEEEYPKIQVAEAYDMRWNGETDLRTLKDTLSLDQVRCLTPDNVEREVWATMLGYNLVRRLASTSAFVTKKKPRDIGFTGTWNIVAASWQFRSVRPGVSDETMQRIYRDISKHRAGHRPGRLEPRVIRKRPKATPKMKKARSEYRRRVTATEIEAQWF